MSIEPDNKCHPIENAQLHAEELNDLAKTGGGLRSATPEELKIIEQKLKEARIDSIESQGKLEDAPRVPEMKIQQPEEPLGSIDKIQIVSSPQYWGKVLQALDKNNRVMVPRWEPLAPDERIPEQANIPISQDALQKLFDGLWSAGVRPTGTKVLMEIQPEPFPSFVQALMDKLCDVMSSAEMNPRYYFEQYWNANGEGERHSVLWKTENDVETIEVEFQDLDGVMTYLWANREMLVDKGEAS